MDAIIEDVRILSDNTYTDSRGTTFEWFGGDDIHLESIFRNKINRVLISKSIKGCVRGIHFTERSRGQYKLITCISGSIEDYFIDLRPESKTFGKCGSVTLSGLDGKSVLIPPGIGHAYQSIQKDTIVSYLLNDNYSTEFESSIRPVGDGSPIVFSMEPTEISIRDLNSITFTDFLSNL
jgi:dTDP-4-dehydrorhamnose 3,5-epimerase